MVMEPWFVTLLLLSTTTAIGPLVLIEPADVIKMSSGVPALTVLLCTGAVVAVSILVSAAAGEATSASAHVEARNRCRMWSPMKRAGEPPEGSCFIRRRR